MIGILKDRYKSDLEGKTFAILASGPSLELFNRKEDFVIGVNGASKLLKPGDFFVSSEEGTYREPWFKNSSADVVNIVRACAAIYSSRFYPDDSLRNKLVEKFNNFLEDNINNVVTRWDGIREIIPEHLQNHFDENIPEPSKPHILMRNVRHYNDGNRYVLPDQKEIIVGGTVSCVALQIAYHLGAREIHLYGVQFTNESLMNNGPGHEYSKLLDSCGGGFTTEEQRMIFQDIISQVQNSGIPVFSHGYTRLENTINLER